MAPHIIGRSGPRGGQHTLCGGIFRERDSGGIGPICPLTNSSRPKRAADVHPIERMIADRSDTEMVIPTPQLPTQSDRLLPNQGLKRDEWITSLDGRFELYLQTPGNLVLGGPQDQTLWTSNTAGDVTS